MIECVVAASILIVAMGTVTTLSYRLNRVWIDVAHQRIAMNELSNTAETLSELPREQWDAAISNLKPSTAALTTLDQPELSGERITDSLGDRVVLRLTWRSAHPIRPVRLTAWLSPLEVSP